MEAHWPAAVQWAQGRLEHAFPGANATDLWVTMQHVYAEAMGEQHGPPL